MTLLQTNPLALGELYRSTLLDNILPFWLRHGMDSQHGGIITSLDADGSVLDTDKSVWFQGRSAWTFATLHQHVEQRPEWLSAAKSCIDFMRQHCYSPEGKMWFTVTRDGQPLRMRRYVYSEAFAVISLAVYAQTTDEDRAATEAIAAYERYLDYSFTPGVMAAKAEPTRPSKGIGAHMIGIVTAQELRQALGDIIVRGRTCTEWIDYSIAEIERDFMKPDLQALLEVVGPNGEILDHAEGRTLNPGHAIECAWFIMHEGRLRSDPRLIKIGTTILDWMWQRGWDQQHGGLLYFTDLKGLPVQEYWHDMKFWWPHCEAIIATMMAYNLTGDERYAQWHQAVHEWSFRHFPDPEHGEWFGYLHRDGRLSQRAKGNLFKGPFHLPRMLLYGWAEAGIATERLSSIP
jgi:N-acylglucosamine 2-epimerase